MKNNHIGRRQLMQYSAASIALAASAKAQAEESLALTQSKETRETDVLVVGGGTAGTIAAIQAARAGAKTILIENGSMLGGTTTVGGVAFPGLFHFMDDGAYLEVDGQVIRPKALEEHYMYPGMKHRFWADETDFRMLVVCFGEWTVEDQVRHEDDYGREGQQLKL